MAFRHTVCAAVAVIAVGLSVAAADRAVFARAEWTDFNTYARSIGHLSACSRFGIAPKA